MGDLTLQDLLDSGIDIQDLLFKQDSPPVEVSVDTDNLVKAFQEAQNINKEVFSAIEETIKNSGTQNKDLLVKALSFILKENNKNNMPTIPITGMKVTGRDVEGRIDEIEFIRETIN
jgi:hypothetical protein